MKHFERNWNSFDKATKGLSLSKQDIFYYGACSVMINIKAAIKHGDKWGVKQDGTLGSTQDMRPLFGILNELMKDYAEVMKNHDKRVADAAPDETPNTN